MPKKTPYISPNGMMTLRDQFALHIAGALCSNPVASACIVRDMEKTGREFASEVAHNAYDFADAMIAERHRRIR